MTRSTIEALLVDAAAAEAGPRVARFLADEVERIIAAVQADPADKQYQVEEIAPRAEALLATCEDAGRLSAAAGYFGPSATVQLWASTLASLVPGRRSGGVAPAWEQLAAYPALLLAYCLGVGASAARRYDRLTWLFTVQLPNERGDWRPLVELVHPFAINERIGPHLSDARFQLSPFSDHLHAVTRPFFRELLIRDDHFEREFDRFELLIGLAGYHLSGATGTEAWIPLGRVLRLGRYTENASRAILGDGGAGTDAGSALLRAMGRDQETIEAALDGFHGAVERRLSQAMFMR